jgi:hypothetical protein
MGLLLRTPTARLVAHSLIAGLATAIPLEVAANFSTTKSVLYGVAAAGCRAALGYITSTNPSVGKNVV